MKSLITQVWSTLAVFSLAVPAQAADATITLLGNIERTQSHRFPDGSYAPDRLVTEVGLQAGDPFTAEIVCDPQTAPQFTSVLRNPIWSSWYSKGTYPAVKSLLITVHTASGDKQFGVAAPHASTYAKFINAVDAKTSGTYDELSGGASGSFALNVITRALEPTFPSDSKLRWSVGWGLVDHQGTALTSAALPTSLDLAAYEAKRVNFYAY